MEIPGIITFINGNNYLFNYGWLTIICFSFIVSIACPNVRWVTGSFALIQAACVYFYESMIDSEGLYYIWVSFFDLAVILSIINRESICLFLVRARIPVISRITEPSLQCYRMTPQELFLVLVFSVSILINLASIVEWLIRIGTDFTPMVVYYAFPFLKYTIDILSLLAIITVALYGYRGYYQKDKFYIE